TVSYLTAGQSYGFEEILASWRKHTPGVALGHTLRAVGFVSLVVIPTALIERYVLEKLPAERMALPLVSADPSSPSRINPKEHTPVSTELLEFMVENRFITGTASMVIDLDRCTRCDDCVRACARAHDNNPRFLRKGPSYGHYMVANACMH